MKVFLLRFDDSSAFFKCHKFFSLYQNNQSYNSPINGDGHEGKDTAAHGDDGNITGDLTIESAKRPMSIEHVHEIEGHVQGRHHGICDAQVHCNEIKRTHS